MKIEQIKNDIKEIEIEIEELKKQKKVNLVSGTEYSKEINILKAKLLKLELPKEKI